ncbi:hypothetical protein RHS01_00021 [Rhizoctonia solani]|uniref:Uncharacterized protein n=1 Tax=Rhizoctonia solani TaxID=456999 RepID=A0A8H7M9Y0_9AGAM|nr:hypothetical protein RHS01_00021 [Rhizoctonia solani]
MGLPTPVAVARRCVPGSCSSGIQIASLRAGDGDHLVRKGVQGSRRDGRAECRKESRFTFAFTQTPTSPTFRRDPYSHLALHLLTSA